MCISKDIYDKHFPVCRSGHSHTWTDKYILCVKFSGNILKRFYELIISIICWTWTTELCIFKQKKKKWLFKNNIDNT